MRLFLALLLGLTMNAQTLTRSEYVRHKSMHVLASALFAFVPTAIIGNWRIGVVIGIAPGIAKEHEDRRLYGESYDQARRDVEYDLAGVAIGAWLGMKMHHRHDQNMLRLYGTLHPVTTRAAVPVFTAAPPLLNTAVCWRLEAGYLRREMR